MGAHVEIRKGSGSTRIVVAGSFPQGETLRFSIFGGRNGYLTSDGWVAKRKFFSEIASKPGDLYLSLSADLSALIPAGTNLIIEEITHNFRATCKWPAAAKPAETYNQLEADLAMAVADDVGGNSPLPQPPDTDASTELLQSPLPFRKRSASLLPWLAAVVVILIVAGAGVMIAGPAITDSKPQDAAAVIIPTEPAAVEADMQSSTQVDQLQAEIESLRSQLAKAPVASTGTADERVSALNLERSLLEARIAEQEKLIARLRNENEVNASADGSREASSYRQDLASARRDIVTLTDENRSLKERVTEQNLTIADYAVKLNELQREMSQLQGQVALKELHETQSDVEASLPVEKWVAAAVTPGGSVEVVTSQPSRNEAASAVMRKCRRKGGQCQLLGVERDQCVSVARPRQQRIMPGNFWEDFSSSRDASARNARGKCDRNSGGQCEVAFSYCASDPSSL